MLMKIRHECSCGHVFEIELIELDREKYRGARDVSWATNR